MTLLPARRQCVTCGGDATLRLWNIDTLQELHKVSVRDSEADEMLLPVDVASCAGDESAVAVVFHESRMVQIWSIHEQQGQSTLSLAATLECQHPALAVSWLDANTVLVLQSDNTNKDGQLVRFTNKSTSKDPIADKKDKSEWSKDVSVPSYPALPDGISLPTTILEKDPQSGVLKMAKMSETRGADRELPWNRVERIEVARANRARHKRNKRRRLRQGDPDTKES